MLMQENRLWRAGVLATLLAAGMGTGVASATPAAQPVAQERVSIADLDLATAAGTRELQQRVNAAIKRVCDAPREATVKLGLDRLHACRRQAWKDVQAQLAHGKPPAAQLATRN